MLYFLISNISDATMLRFSEVDWMLFTAAFILATAAALERAQSARREEPLPLRSFAAARLGSS
jgi:TRAP-type mannitol/chloroaromatic compound transport system permease small subunit